MKDLTLLYNFFHEITVCGPSHSAKPERNDPPSSWSEEDKALFASLPRPTQERLAERERVRASELAEQRKAVEADRAKLDEARQQYEATLPQLLAALQVQQAMAPQGERIVRVETKTDLMIAALAEVRDILRQRLRN